MNSPQDRQKRFDAAMAEVALLPAEQQVDALLQYFTAILNTMSVDAMRQKRDQLMGHFANCGCSYDTCAALLEMVDYHIAIRERWATRQETEARRATAPSLRSAADGPARSSVADGENRQRRKPSR